MGMIENARASLAIGVQSENDTALLVANAQASIAVAESLDGVMQMLEALHSKLDAIDSAVMMIANND